MNINTLVFVGMTTNHCISSTVRMSGNLGFETYLISDSTACYDTMGMDGKMIDCNIIYESSLANLSTEFAKIINFPLKTTFFHRNRIRTRFLPAHDGWLA